VIFPVLPNVGEEGKDPSRSLPGFLEAQESSQMNQTPGVGRTEGVCLAGTSLHLRRQMNERRNENAAPVFECHGADWCEVEPD